MSRIRTIKPDFWRHEDLSELPEATHMLAAALLNYADDEGYFNANEKLVKAECCPLRETSVSVHDSIMALAKIGYLRLGTGPDGKRYGHVVAFLQHQRVNRPQPSKISGLDVAWDGSLNNHTQITERSSPEGNGREGKGREKNPPAAAKEYVFVGNVGRVDQRQFDKWRESFEFIPDLKAELQVCDDYYTANPIDDPKKWFWFFSKWLGRANDAAREKHQPKKYDYRKDPAYAGVQ